MESFIISNKLKDRQVDLLVIPDNCYTHSIFHLVVNEMEVNKLQFSETTQWELVDGDRFSEEEFKQITQKIEQHFLY